MPATQSATTRQSSPAERQSPNRRPATYAAGPTGVVNTRPRVPRSRSERIRPVARNAIAKIESALPRLGETLDLTIQSKRTEPRTNTANLVPYGVEVVSIDHPGIVRDIANFFSKRDINIEDLYTSTYLAPHTGAPMFSLHMTVGVPADTAIAALRGEFMDFCDDMNVDAMLAPVK